LRIQEINLSFSRPDVLSQLYIAYTSLICLIDSCAAINRVSVLPSAKLFELAHSTINKYDIYFNKAVPNTYLAVCIFIMGAIHRFDVLILSGRSLFAQGGNFTPLTVRGVSIWLLNL